MGHPQPPQKQKNPLPIFYFIFFYEFYEFYELYEFYESYEIYESCKIYEIYEFYEFCESNRKMFSCWVGAKICDPFCWVSNRRRNYTSWGKAPRG